MYFSTTDDGIDLGKIQDDLDFLYHCFIDMLRETGENEVADVIENKKYDYSDLVKISKAFTLFFQLTTIVEENAAVQLRRKLENEHGINRISGLWGKTIQDLKESGFTEKEITETLSRTHIEPVLTAHPTESKRSTVIDQLRSIYLLMVKRENQVWTEYERRQIRNEIIVAMQRVWHTGQVYLQKPSIQDELRNVMYYLTNMFPRTIPMLDQRLRDAWEANGFDLNALNDRSVLPKVHFGNWVGGDRDGHPFVTEQVTDDTLYELRKSALRLLKRDLSNLARKASLSMLEVKVPPEVYHRISELASDCGDDSIPGIKRNPDEPWRQLLNLMQLKLPLDDRQEPIKEPEPPRYYADERGVLRDLDLMSQSLNHIHAGRIARYDIEPVARKAETFGFHLASLDIRQNSKFHDRAMSQLLEAAKIEDGQDFSDWPEEKRYDFLKKELESSRPFVSYRETIGKEIDAVLSSYHVLRNHIKRYGNRGIGALIVSMTRNVSDLLVVYVLCREAGLMTHTPEGMACEIQVVPLFETIDDLQAGPVILDRFLNDSVTRRTIEYLTADSKKDGCQQVMVGYSDSNKDGGILASLWGLHHAQKELTAVGKKHGIRIRFFHGRGGTISRGAGPTHRFIAGLPPESLEGDLRLTEQGEVISQKYANLLTALYNLELLQAGTTGLSMGVFDKSESIKKSENVFNRLEPVVDRLYGFGRERYLSLVRSEDFVSFYSQATPIDLIEASRIGSRPSRRTEKRSFEDLRAIPWVFSWSQSRFYLTGWYGVGSALEQLKEDDPEAFTLLSRYAVHYMPFRYIITSASSAIALAEPDIMKTYASLVIEKSLADKYMTQVMSEFERTRGMLEILYGHKLNERRPRMHQMMTFRSERLKPLHQLQTEQLSKWRELKVKGEKEKADHMLPEMLLVLNAIAGGLGTTG